MALSPEQRALVNRMRKVLAPLPREDRRQLIEHMRAAWHAVSGPALARFEQNMAKLCALELAMEERIGYEPPEGTPVLPEDERRAEEIFAACWRNEL